MAKNIAKKTHPRSQWCGCAGHSEHCLQNMNTCRIEVHATTDAISVAERIGRIRPVKRNGYDGEVSESVKLPTNQRL